jgi:hypothetical protein
MLGKRKIVFIFMIVGLIMISACSFGGILPSVPTVQPVQIEIDTAVVPTSTRRSLPTLMPTGTNTPQPTIQVCDANAALDMMEKIIPYAEYEIYFFTEDGKTSLVVWFVDHQLNLSTSKDAFTENLKLSQNHVVMLAQQLNFAEPCMGRLFDEIAITVADQYYNAWFDGKIHPALLPNDIVTDPQQLQILINQFEVTYLRDQYVEALPAAPAGSCTWKEVHQRILTHMDANEKNNAFFYASSLLGRTIVAQWEGNIADFASDAYLTTLESIGEEAKCLFPEPNLILYYMVDESATAISGGMWYLVDPKNPDLLFNTPFLLN